MRGGCSSHPRRRLDPLTGKRVVIFSAAPRREARPRGDGARRARRIQDRGRRRSARGECGATEQEHLGHAFRKLNVATRSEAAARAWRLARAWPGEGRGRPATVPYTVAPRGITTTIAAKDRARRRGGVEPHEDYGFFGPDSVTWRVWGYPTSLTVGFQRSVVIEELDPALIAAVDQTDRSATGRDPLRPDAALLRDGRVRRLASASRPSDVLVKVHSKAVGVEPTQRQPLRRQRPATRSCGSTSPRGTRSSTRTSATAPAALATRRRGGSGRSARSPPSCRRATRPTCRARARESASTSPRCARSWPARR